MSKSKQMVLDYLEKNSDEQKAVRNFIQELSKMVRKSSNGDYASGSSEFNKDFEDLFVIIKDIKTDFVPYSEITRIIYTCDNTDGIDMFFLKFNEKLSENIKKYISDGENVDDGYIILIKTVEHMKLANKQVESLYKKQNREIQEQNNNLTDIEQKLKKTKKKLKKFDNMKSSIYGDFIAILGIFSALIFTLFGSFKTFTAAISQISRGVSIVRITISLSLLGIIMLCLLFFLLKAIATMSDRKLSLGDGKCIYKKYPFFMYGLTVMTIVFGISLIYYYCVYH